MWPEIYTLSRSYNCPQNVETLVVQGISLPLPPSPSQAMLFKNEMEAMTTRAPVCSTNIEQGGRGAVLQRLLRVVVAIVLFFTILHLK